MMASYSGVLTIRIIVFAGLDWVPTVSRNPSIQTIPAGPLKSLTITCIGLFGSLGSC